MMTKDELLQLLPQYRDVWITIKRRQYVPDIVTEMKSSYDAFGKYYDMISPEFAVGEPVDIAGELYDFCRENIQYREETEHDQTTALPTGILVRGYGDCKHYAAFIGGVLGSIKRIYGLGFPLYYYFASYNDSKEPYHVFTVIEVGGIEYWIDPTPGADSKDPTYLYRTKL